MNRSWLRSGRNRPGATSGNRQELIAARWDGDRDAVLFRIIQSGPTCHTGQANCFRTESHNVFYRLDTTLGERATGVSTGSYTRRLLDDPKLVTAKLREEIEEVIEAEAVDEVAWEVSDVLYHLLVKARSRDVSLIRVRDELRSRMRA